MAGQTIVTPSAGTPRRGLCRSFFTAVAVAFAVAVGTGCEAKSFLDPSELGRIQRKPLVMPIMGTLDTGVEEPGAQFAASSDPTPADLQVSTADYRIQRADIVSVTISDLQGPGIESTYTRRVSESGRISLPFVRQVNAVGLTELELQEAVEQAYRDAQVITNPEVTATVTEYRGRTYSVLGSVYRPGQYLILEPDYRVLDALVQAGDVTNRGVTELYIIREPQAGSAREGTEPPARRPANAPPTDPLAPQSRADVPDRPVYLQAEQPDEDPAPAANTPPEPFAFRPTTTSRQRVIRIPVDKLKNGNLAYNVVIQPKDMIIVPEAATSGLYYMGGHVSRPGVFAFQPGERLTLSRAVVAAGMLDPLAIPERTEIVRPVGDDKQVFARVDLGKIFEGSAPDVYLKPGDRVQVGTNALAPFIATIRGAFRFTYGFGFLYDRNFAAEENEGDNN